MMKRLVIALAFWPAVASAVYEPYDTSHRKCTTDDDCTYVIRQCNGPMAVNKAHKEKVQQRLNLIMIECNRAAPDYTPIVACVDGLCTITNEPK